MNADTSPMLARTIPFRVDVAGVVEILGSSLYSRIETPIRELIQNAHDGINRRRQSDLDFEGRIDVVQDPEQGTLSFEDDGIGLSPDEAEAYLGTLGTGITGLLKAEAGADKDSSSELIGQFGIGLFSAFLLAERIVVETRRASGEPSVRWEAGAGTDITLAPGTRTEPGTCVTLHLRPSRREFAEQAERIEQAIREFADFLPVPIHLNGRDVRVNTMTAMWLEATPEPEALELELTGTFEESPLFVLPIKNEGGAAVSGALFVSSQRTPGLTDPARVMVTVRRMMISRDIRQLLPPWATFVRGVLELPTARPTASREDLVRDDRFEELQRVVGEALYAAFERLGEDEPEQLRTILRWHRYMVAAFAIEDPRLRAIVRNHYGFNTSEGERTFADVLAQSKADPMWEAEASHVVWFSADYSQHSWINQVFAGQGRPCVHATRSFEETLLAMLVADEAERGHEVDLRVAKPSADRFSESVLGLRDPEELPPEWTEFFTSIEAEAQLASFGEAHPVLVFVDDRRALANTFERLRDEGRLPLGFREIMERHLDATQPGQHEVVLNRRHRLVAKVLAGSVKSPLASVLRVQVISALRSAGIPNTRRLQTQLQDDLDWVADSME